MKRYIYLMVLLITFSGCQSKYNLYSGDSAVFFDVYSDGLVRDTTQVSFTYIEGKELSYQVPIVVRLIGDVVDYDREVKIKATPKNCVSGDYETISETQILRAGRSVLMFNVVVNRSEELKKTEKIIDLELVANDNFALLYPAQNNANTGNLQISCLKHTIVFSELMNQEPETWSDYYFGLFSAKKFITICNEMNIPRLKFNNPAYMSYGRKMYIATKMKEILEQHKADGNTIYEDDAKTIEMKMGDKI